MKTRLTYLLTALFCLILAGCSNDEPVFTLSQDKFTDVPPEGKTLSLQIETAGEWTATSLNKDWCTVSPGKGTGNATITIEVAGNIAKDRTGTVTIYCNGAQTNISITQKALPEGEELTYRIPVIFHVLYKDKNDPHQYISANRIKQVLDKVNQYYDGKTIATGGDAGQDINLEFYLPETDAQGNTLETPGVEYITWDEMPIDCENFMESSSEKIKNLLWDMNKYINIMLYNFTQVEDGGIILGISHLPLSTQGKNYLEGLQAVEYTHMENSNLGYPQCVSINSLYFDQDTPSGGYNSGDANVTLAHELGHYLGLHHAFNEDDDPNADSDYCTDTKPYNRNLYQSTTMIEAYRAYMASGNFADLLPGFERVNSLDPDDTFTSYNLMDYEISYADRFSLNQRERMRHVLEYSPLIPGPKKTASTRSVAPQGVLDIPIIYKVCYKH